MADGFHILARFWLRPGDFGEFARLSAEEIWPAFERLGPRVTGLYLAREPDPHPAVPGPSEMAVMTISYTSEAHWQAALSRVRERVDEVDEADRRMQEGMAKRGAMTLAASLLPMLSAAVPLGVPYSYPP